MPDEAALRQQMRLRHTLGVHVFAYTMVPHLGSLVPQNCLAIGFPAISDGKVEPEVQVFADPCPRIAARGQSKRGYITRRMKRRRNSSDV